MLKVVLVWWVSVAAAGWVGAATVAHWDFNSVPADWNTTSGTLLPAAGGGRAEMVGGVTGSFTASNGSSDTHPSDNSNWRITTWPAQGTQNKLNGVRFDISTVGYRHLRLTWDQRNSNTASRYARLQYTTNGSSFLDMLVVTMPSETWVNGQAVSFAGVAGVEDNPRFGVRFVTEFERTATGSGLDGYVPSNPTGSYGSVGTLRFDQVRLTGEPTVDSFSLLTYNILGHSATNWTLDLTQVQAIGRQLAYLSSDIIGFQEIPEAFEAQMEEFLAVWLPDYQLALGRRTDGGERSGVASRFPIRRSQSWLAREGLVAFGYEGVFTRDLFEAEIAVPGFPEPLHFFTTHLKASSDEASSARRAAEARAISNHLTMQFLPAYAGRSYTLVGDLNEDIYRPRPYEQQAVQTLTSSPTGLRLTTPRNPVSNDERTWSIQNANLTIRFDYVLPCGFLYSNIVSSQVFRSDKVLPLVAPLRATDSRDAADHLPVLLVLGNPYAPPRISGAGWNAGEFQFAWTSQPGQRYRIEASTDCVSWYSNNSVTVVSGTNGSFSALVSGPATFFRVVRQF